MTALKRTDVKLLRDALASNGGGVHSYLYADTTIGRNFFAGRMKWKLDPNCPGLIVITPAGKEGLKAHK